MTFPLDRKPLLDYKTCPRAFGCPRENGARKHAGVDLYAPVGTPVRAIADGEVIRPLYLFYRGTFAIEIRHEFGIVRYCEMENRQPVKLKLGDRVSEGQQLGYVGRIVGLKVSMLHVELYRGDATGRLTQRVAPYQRRADLIDPTPLLDSISGGNTEA